MSSVKISRYEAVETGVDRGKVVMPSPTMDVWIRLRERFLAKVFPSSPLNSFNHANSKAVEVPSADLSATLKRAIDMLIVAAMDEEGYNVDYQRLRNSEEYSIYQQDCSVQLRYFNPQSLSTEDARCAFWINLYNVLILDSVIAFVVQRSVTEGRLGLLKFFRRAAYIVDGKPMCLDDIEHGILRGNQGHPAIPGAHFASDDPRLAWSLAVDPRIHFALNCASRSCPPIQSYSADRLDEELELAAHSFVNSSVDALPEQNQICASMIFRWYERDFGGRQGVLGFLTRYLPNGDRKRFLLDAGESVRLSYLPYDWGLNTF